MADAVGQYLLMIGLMVFGWSVIDMAVRETKSYVKRLFYKKCYGERLKGWQRPLVWLYERQL